MNYEKHITICKRRNNANRSFLVCNDLQCKHVPSSPTKALDMFKELANKFIEFKNRSDVLVIGFAETATAIGAAVACELNVKYVHTTRENVNQQTFTFTESHSHAPVHLLPADILNGIKTVVIVEDELTTGSTVLKLCRALKTLQNNVALYVGTIADNRPTDSNVQFNAEGIIVKSLVSLDTTYFDLIARDVIDNERLCTLRPDIDNDSIEVRVPNPRRVVDSAEYTACLNDMCNRVEVPHGNGITLVLGTEECMYPAIYLGSYLEDKGCRTVCHATTRSPIVTSDKPGYVLRSGVCMRSVYDLDRITYLYNLRKYDKVFIVTDSCNELNDLIVVLQAEGCADITVIRLKEVL